MSEVDPSVTIHMQHPGADGSSCEDFAQAMSDEYGPGSFSFRFAYSQTDEALRR